MDDFYNEMKSTLQDIESSNLVAQKQDSYGMLQTYFPTMFAEALVPINPIHWPSYVAGSALSNEMPEFGDKIKTPLDNLVVVGEYLETPQSDIQWRDRLWKVVEDTITINLSCELGQGAGSFGAGVLSNKMAENYMNEMVETSLTLNTREKLNQKIFQQVALDRGLDPSIVRGTGVNREFMPDSMKGDIFDRPERNARPSDDDPGQGGLPDGAILDNPNNPNDLGGSNNSVFASASCSVETETENSLLDRFFNLFGFGAGSDDGMCPAPSETNYYHSTDLMERLFDFFIPETGGGYYCTDPAKCVPPTPYLGDIGDFTAD